jgi:hypothetical protein
MIMIKSLPSIVVALALASGIGSANAYPQRQQYPQQQHMGTPQQQRACHSDAARFCRHSRDDFATADCLRAHIDRLRSACRRVLQGG